MILLGKLRYVKYYIMRGIEFALEACKLIIIYPIARLFFKKNHIIISERGTDARDNGYHLFKYYRDNYPDKNIYYIISKDSPDYNKIRDLGNIILYRSIRHYIMFYNAKIKISSHIMGFAPDVGFYKRLNKIKKFPGKQVMIQHGITYNYLDALNYQKSKLDLIIASAKKEYEYFQREYKYPKEAIVYSGLSRFDNLINESDGTMILIMPTWRYYLKNASEEEIIASDYVKGWNAILKSDRLNECLKNNSKKIIFYLHHEMQKYSKLFSGNSENIIVAEKENYDVQKLLKETALLITDYSSIFFDFAYMEKTCLFYQFDKMCFYETQYKKGYFDLDNDGFGKISYYAEGLIDDILESIKNEFCIEEKYKEKIDSFFEIRDGRSCERIVDAIGKLE